MPETSRSRDDEIEVRVKKGASKRTVKMADQMNALLNSPVFERMVRQAVEEMCVEGKLVYDGESDSFKESEDQVRDWAANMEREGWSLKKGRTSPKRKRRSSLEKAPK